MPTIQVDLAHDCDHRQECRTLAARHNLRFRLLKLNGPAGGNPLYEFTGSRHDLEVFVMDFYSNEFKPHDHESFDYFLSRIKD